MKKLTAAFIILVIVTSVTILLFHLSVVDSVSMEPTLLSGDIVLCSRDVAAKDIRLNDVIIFRSLEDDSTLLVKRVHDIKYESPDSIKYDVRGDSKGNSCDSRSFGLVPMVKIDGKVWLVLASWNKEKKSFRSERFWKRLN